MEFYLGIGPLRTAGEGGMTKMAGRGKGKKKACKERFSGGEILLEFFLVI
jgi:nitrogen regulatory protein PII